MAQPAAKQAGPATAQEDAPVRPTKYTLDDFAPGLRVTGKAAGGTRCTGTIMKVGFSTKGQAHADPNLIEIQQDTAAPEKGRGPVLLDPPRGYGD